MSLSGSESVPTRGFDGESRASPSWNVDGSPFAEGAQDEHGDDCSSASPEDRPDEKSESQWQRTVAGILDVDQRESNQTTGCPSEKNADEGERTSQR